MVRSSIAAYLLLCGTVFAQGAAALADGQAASSNQGPATVGKAAAVNPSALPDARVLAVTESALKYCNGIDSSAALKLELQKRKLVKGVSENALDKIRESDEYRHAYAAESDFVSKVDEHNAKRICMQPLAKRR